MIIALEGGICSGKTTLAKEFERQDFYLIPEYMDIIHPYEEDMFRKHFYRTVWQLLNIRFLVYHTALYNNFAPSPALS